MNYSDLLLYLNENEIEDELDRLRQKVIDPNFDLNKKKSFGYSINEMLISCEFDSNKCDSSDFDWIYHALYGNCYRFNSKTFI